MTRLISLHVLHYCNKLLWLLISRDTILIFRIWKAKWLWMNWSLMWCQPGLEENRLNACLWPGLLTDRHSLQDTMTNWFVYGRCPWLLDKIDLFNSKFYYTLRWAATKLLEGVLINVNGNLILCSFLFSLFQIFFYKFCSLLFMLRVKYSCVVFTVEDSYSVILALNGILLFLAFLKIITPSFIPSVFYN